jgi:hypothetical protein
MKKLEQLKNNLTSVYNRVVDAKDRVGEYVVFCAAIGTVPKAKTTLNLFLGKQKTPFGS